MNVYVESNFVLELAFEQEQHEACREILTLAATRRLDLRIPAYSLIEPAERLRRSGHQRLGLQMALASERRELRRTRSFSPARNDAWDVVMGDLVRTTQDAERRFDELRRLLVDSAVVLPLNERVIERASTLALRPPDAVVLATVLEDLEPGVPSCFLNRNTRDFDDPAVVKSLAAGNCKLIGRFDAGLSLLRMALAAE